MSLFGNGFCEEVYNEIPYIIMGNLPGEHRKEEQLKFIAEIVSNILEGDYDKVPDKIKEEARKKNMSYGDMAEQLAHMYATVVKWEEFKKLDVDLKV